MTSIREHPLLSRIAAAKPHDLWPVDAGKAGHIALGDQLHSHRHL